MLTERTELDAYLGFDRAPRRVYWEVTRACDLACRHCRAVAAPDPYSAELTERDGLALIEVIAPRQHEMGQRRTEARQLVAVASASPWHRAPCRS